MKRIRISKISALHYFKLIFRSVLFIIALVAYILSGNEGETSALAEFFLRPVVLGIIWTVFVTEMILRFFPSPFESMGCQKQFKRNYIPKQRNNATRPTASDCGDAVLLAGDTEGGEAKDTAKGSKKRLSAIAKETNRGVLAVSIIWIILNGAIGALYYTDIIDAGILLLICLGYSVCDMICILFFCPFQTWFMKNKCCGSCRIYNWDYAMMFTPLVFIRSVYSWSLLGIALLLLIVWELSARIHPERFSERTNSCLSCNGCREKLCHHKTQLRHFLKVNKDNLILKGNTVIDKTKELLRKDKK